jgi:hypothetical protein
MNTFEYVSTLLGPLQFTFRGAEVWFPGPTFRHPTQSSCSTERTLYTFNIFGYAFLIATSAGRYSSKFIST